MRVPYEKVPCDLIHYASVFQTGNIGQKTGNISCCAKV